MTQSTEVIEWLNRLNGIGFPTLVGLILFGSYIGIWMWTKQHREIVAIKDARIAELEAQVKEWKQMALGLLTPLESTVRKGRG